MKKIALVTVVCAFLTAPAMADLLGTVNVHELNTNPGVTAGITSTGFKSGPAVYIGVYNLQLTGVAGVPARMTPYLNGNVQSFCIDLWDLSAPSTAPYLVKTLDEVPDAQEAPGNDGMGPVKAGYLATLLNKYWVGGLSNNEAAALQSAVWEIVDEDRSNPGNPNTGAWNTSSISCRWKSWSLSAPTTIERGANGLSFLCLSARANSYSGFV